MPNRWAVANGNWSAAATWSGSLKPTSNDDVFSNNFTVNVDESFTVLSLNNTATTGVTAGGTFNFNTAGVSGSATSITSCLGVGAANLLQITAATGLVNINLSSAVSSGGVNGSVITHTGNCNLNINGVSFTGGISTVNADFCIGKSSTGTITITGSLFGSNGSANADKGAFSSTNGNTIIVGNVIGGTAAVRVRTILQTAGSLTITGNITPMSAFSSNGSTVNFTGTTLTINGNLVTGVGANVLSSGTTIITGDVNGTTNASGYGLSTSGVTTINGNVIGATGTGIVTTSTAALTVNGNVSSTGGGAGIASTAAANVITVNGNVSASSAAPAIFCTVVGNVLILSGSLYNTNGRQAAYVPNILVNQSLPMVAQFFSSAGQNITMYSQDTLANYPSASNVRQGTVYGVASGSTGTLAIPNATDVRSGVTYDATTTGSGLFTTDTLLSEISSSSVPVAARIRNAGTVEVLGKLLESFRK